MYFQGKMPIWEVDAVLLFVDTRRPHNWGSKGMNLSEATSHSTSVSIAMMTTFPSMMRCKLLELKEGHGQRSVWKLVFCWKTDIKWLIYLTVPKKVNVAFIVLPLEEPLGLWTMLQVGGRLAPKTRTQYLKKSEMSIWLHCAVRHFFPACLSTFHTSRTVGMENNRIKPFPVQNVT